MSSELDLAWQRDETLAWVRGIVGEPQAPRVLNDKGWSVVVHLGVAVLKVTTASAFPDGPRMFSLVDHAAPGRVPQLLAWRTASDGSQEMLFQPFGGVPIGQIPLASRSDALVEMARTTGQIQAAVRSSVPKSLATIAASDVPTMLDELLEHAVVRCRTDHADRWGIECTAQEIPESLAETLRPWRTAVADWAHELDSGGWSNSIDHVDLLPHNVNLLPDGGCIVYDWEQATLGVPFFSLDILLAYAQSLDTGTDGLCLRPEQATPTQFRLREAYLSELPGPLDLALRLAPIRYAWSEWRQAETAGLARYGVDDVAWWLGRALRRWERA